MSIEKRIQSFKPKAERAYGFALICISQYFLFNLTEAHGLFSIATTFAMFASLLCLGLSYLVEEQQTDLSDVFNELINDISKKDYSKFKKYKL